MAFVGPVFVTALVTLFEFTYLAMAQLVVDEAAQRVAREIQTGQAQAQTSQANFNSNVVCPALVILPCANLLINIQAVTVDYTSTAGFAVPVSGGKVSSAGFNYCNGQPGQLMQVNAVYFAPVLLTGLLPQAITFGTTTTLPIMAAAAFGDEWFPLTGTLASPC
jgi:Flp pilus assembly protein TadG